MANSRIKDLTERTTLSTGDYLVTDNNEGTRKVDVNKVLTPISTAQTTADNVAGKVSKSSDAFSSSKGYSVGELCIYNNKVYRCKTAYSTGASWASRSTYFEEVSLVDAVSDLNSALTTLENGFYSNCGSTGTNQFDLNVMGKQAILTFHFVGASANANAEFIQTIPEGYRPSITISRTFTGCNSAGTGIVTSLTVKPTGKMCFTTTVTGIYGNGSCAWIIP